MHSLPKSDLTRFGDQTIIAPTTPRRDAAPKGPLEPHADTIPMTCFYWNMRSDCPAGKEQCRFTHGECVPMRKADRELHLQVLEEGTTAWKPKFWSPTKVCFFWNKGECHQGDTGCWFAHWRPKKVPWVVHRANDDKRWPKPIDGSPKSAPQPEPVPLPESVPPSAPRNIPYQKTWGVNKKQCYYWEKLNYCRDGKGCKWMHGYVDSAVDTAQQQSLPDPPHIPSGKFPKTCPWWYYKVCKKTDEECTFVHELLEDIADFKPPLKICPFWIAGDGCSKSASVCKFLHQYVEGVPIGGDFLEILYN